MSRFVAFAFAIAAVSCASPRASAPVATAPITASPVAAVTHLPSLTPPPTEAPVPSSTPLPPAVAAILDNPENDLHLAPLPAGHTAAVDRDAAIAATLRDWNVTGPIVYLGHGLHGGEPVWLVIAKVQDMAPIPVGPSCVPPPDPCQQTWAVNDYLVKFISDQTGKVAPGGFTTMREIPAPT